jgi:hypothetical protein
VRDRVEELMGLVDEYVSSVEFGPHVTGIRSAEARKDLESAIRALVCLAECVEDVGNKSER